MDLRSYLEFIDDIQTEPEAGDVFELEVGDTLIETTISEVTEDGIIIHLDETAMRIMIDAKKQLNEWMKMGADSDASAAGSMYEDEDLDEAKPGLWANIHAKRKRIKSGSGEKMRKPGSKGAPSSQDFKDAAKTSKNESEDMDEAKYQGREVPLGKPMAGDVKKSKVYVKGPKGNVVKVNFGDKKMKIKKSNPKRRKSFRARHNCDNPGPRWKARYWSCRAW